MKNKFFLLSLGLCILNSRIYSVEYTIQFENEQVCSAYLKIMPGEETEYHYDELSSVVIALTGGILTRLEADGSQTQVEFPTGQSVFVNAETPDKMHKTVNATSKTIELIIVQLKK